MKLALVGISHRTAPVELRERLAFRPEEIGAALMEVQARGAKEAMILSTCNRVELAVALREQLSPETLLEGLLIGRDGLKVETLQPHFYFFEDSAVIRHLFRVASSLDSMIVGEPQILGQLKQAFAQARDQGAIGNVLETVVTRAFSVAKRVRSETEIGQSAVSVSYAAVELAREIFGSLNKKRVLIIGAGKMSEGTARHLARAGATDILITNRSPVRAAELAHLFHAGIIDYDAFPGRLHEMDIIITSSAAPEYVLSREIIRKAIEARRSEPMFLIDIAVPRNIDPEVNTIEHAFLYDIDDLQRVAERNLEIRREVSQQAETIVAQEVTRLEARLRERAAAPTIASLQEQLEAIRRDVLERYRARLGPLTPDQEEAIEAMTRGIVNKIAHGPISEIRRHAGERTTETEAASELISAVRRIFHLREH